MTELGRRRREPDAQCADCKERWTELKSGISADVSLSAAGPRFTARWSLPVTSYPIRVTGQLRPSFIYSL